MEDDIPDEVEFEFDGDEEDYGGGGASGGGKRFADDPSPPNAGGSAKASGGGGGGGAFDLDLDDAEALLMAVGGSDGEDGGYMETAANGDESDDDYKF